MNQLVSGSIRGKRIGSASKCVNAFSIYFMSKVFSVDLFSCVVLKVANAPAEICLCGFVDDHTDEIN